MAVKVKNWFRVVIINREIQILFDMMQRRLSIILMNDESIMDDCFRRIFFLFAYWKKESFYNDIVTGCGYEWYIISIL